MKSRRILCPKEVSFVDLLFELLQFFGRAGW